MATIKELQAEAHQIAVEKGWWENDRNIGEQIALMHSELSEALEEWRRNPAPGYVYYGASFKPEGFGVELADCVIRILDTCETYGLDLEALIVEKMAYNRTRAYRHGNKSA